MAKQCEQCSKKPAVGHLVSHSNRKTLRRYLPNLMKRKFFDTASGKFVVRKLCTNCMRTMVKVKKAKTEEVAA